MLPDCRGRSLTQKCRNCSLTCQQKQGIEFLVRTSASEGCFTREEQALTGPQLLARGDHVPVSPALGFGDMNSWGLPLQTHVNRTLLPTSTAAPSHHLNLPPPDLQ